MSRQSFSADQRIKKGSEFLRVYQANAYAADDVLVVQIGGNEMGQCRLGLSVSRKVGNAVVRNRWKRLVRDAFRRQSDQMPTGVDIVVRPRKGAVPNQAAVAASLPRLVHRACKKLKRKE